MHAAIENPFWQALETEHASFAIGSELARRYPADILPFAAIPRATVESARALRELLEPGETVYVEADLSSGAGLSCGSALEAWQMHFPPQLIEDTLTAPSRSHAVRAVHVIRALDAADAPAMMALAEAAPPGFYRLRSYVLGTYFGIHVDGKLVAMAGERVAIPGFREISGVCTHPAHVGQGYAAQLIRHLLRVHFSAGLRSFLHVKATNTRAVSLYERLGFERVLLVRAYPLCRDS